MNELVIPVKVMGEFNITYYGYDIGLLWFNSYKQETIYYDFKLIKDDLLRYDTEMYVEHLYKNILFYSFKNDIIIPFTYTQIKTIINKILNKIKTDYDFEFEEIIKLKL